MEEMLKKKKKIINKFEFRKKEEINEYMCKNFYLTQSEIREIFQILEDMDSVEPDSLEKIINKFEIDIKLKRRINDFTKC